MEQKEQKINFFKRMKIAIFKLEDYGLFLGERFKVALKYFLILVLILSAVMAFFEVKILNEVMDKANIYIKEELPEFTYKEGKMVFDEKIDAFDHEYRFKLFVDTDLGLTEENIKNYKNQIKKEPYGLLVLSDRFIYLVGEREAEYRYQDIIEASNLQITNKQDLARFLSQDIVVSLNISFYIVSLIALYVSNVVVIISDVILIALFGMIAARFCGLRFKLTPIFSLSIYSLTLSIILLMINVIINNLTGFVINYFDIMYLLIAYVYIIAAILMIKYDLIKQHFEIEKIVEVQKQVHEELEEKKEEKQEEKQEDKEKDEKQVEDESENREPDGSEI